MSIVIAFIRRHPVPAYFGLTFVISWGGMLLAIGSAGGMRGTTPDSDPRFVYALIAMLAGPSLTGLLLAAVLEGHSGLRQFLSRLLTWRVGARWYAVALLTAPVIMTATLLALSFISPAFLPGIFISDDKTITSARQSGGGRVCRHRRGTGVDGVCDPDTETALECPCRLG